MVFVTRIIGVVSGKGGVGKTFVAINLGLAIKDFGQETVVVDTDFTASNLGIHLGIYPYKPFTLQSVLKGLIHDISKCVYIHPTGLKIIPSSLSLERLDVKVMRLKSTLKKLTGYVIVDSPAGLDKEATTVLRACDDVIVVTNPELSAVADAVKVIHEAQELKKNVIGAVINRVSTHRYQLKPHEVSVALEVPILSIIPESSDVSQSIFEKVPVVRYRPYSEPAIEIKKIAAKILDINYERPKFSRLKNIFGSKPSGHFTEFF
jgi:septum site-determining protein MinD